MAEKCIDLPLAPEANKCSGAESRRHSAGKASSGNSKEKIVPHYLRASTGSCHNFCKYGRKYAFEAKEKHFISKSVVRKPVHHSSDESISGKMRSAAKLGASVDSKQTKMSAVKHRDSKLQIYCTGDQNKEELLTKSSESQGLMGNEVLVNRNKTSSVKVKSPLFQKSHLSYPAKTGRQEISSSFMVGTSNSISKKEETPLKVIPGRVKPLSKSTLMTKTLSKPTSKKIETSSKLSSLKGKEIFSVKRVVSLNQNSVAKKTLSSMGSSKGFGGQRNLENKAEKGEASSKPSLKRIPSIKARKHKSLKIVSHLKNESKPRKIETKEHNDEIEEKILYVKEHDEVEEKTLYVIKMENENQTLQSDQNASLSEDVELSLSHSLSSPQSSSSLISQFSTHEDQEESEYATSDFEEDSSIGNHEAEYMENDESLEVEKNDELIVCGEGKDSKLLRLKFIRGKSVDAQFEKSSPRRLKFRQGKVLSSNATDVKVGATTGPEVILRRQDVEDKKEGQGLFNNVIEETASKLVETQKSKVKALVGAFETIISLQEKRPFANIVG